MSRTGVRRRRPGPAIRAPRFAGMDPPRWRLKRVRPGEYVIVDEHGVNVLAHFDPVERRTNFHVAKFGCVAQWVMAYQFEYWSQFARDYAPSPTLCDHALRMMAEALRESTPWHDDSRHVAVNTLAASDKQHGTDSTERAA